MAAAAALPSSPPRPPSIFFLSSSSSSSSNLPILHPTPSSTRTPFHASLPLLSSSRPVWHWGHDERLRCESRRRSRGDAVVVRAGAPSTTTLILAFVFPLSLIIGTIFASIRIADNLDEQYLEELAMNQAIIEEKEAEEDEDSREDDGEGEENDAITAEEVASVEVATAPQMRNRPKKEV